MPAVAMRVLKTALETGVFDGVYLFHGDDDFLKEEKVRALIERATDRATRDFNVDVRRLHNKPFLTLRIRAMSI